MARSAYGPELFEEEASDGGTDLGFGLTIGLLFSIPLWALIGAVLIAAFQTGPIGEPASLAFMIAAVVEAVLVRYAFRRLGPGLWGQRLAAVRRAAGRAWEAMRQATRGATTAGELAIADLENLTGRRIVSIEDMLRVVAVPQPAMPAGGSGRARSAQRSTLRHTAGFAALATAFLQYYFWDVSLQIASMQSVIVFVAVPSLVKTAT